MKEIADALQEAHDLLEKIHSAYSESQGDVSIYQLRKTLAVVKSALAKPLRNCDVGTPQEQAKRFKNYCKSKVCNRNVCHSYGYEELFHHKYFPIWGQMTYVEGANDEQK